MAPVVGIRHHGRRGRVPHLNCNTFTHWASWMNSISQILYHYLMDIQDILQSVYNHLMEKYDKTKHFLSQTTWRDKVTFKGGIRKTRRLNCARSDNYDYAKFAIGSVEWLLSWWRHRVETFIHIAGSLCSFSRTRIGGTEQHHSVLRIAIASCEIYPCGTIGARALTPMWNETMLDSQHSTMVMVNTICSAH